MPTKNNLRFVFFGTPDVASNTLDILEAHGFLPTLVVTAPDRPIGRHFTITPTPVKVWAEARNIPVETPEKIDEEFIARLSRESWDLFIVVAYGKILPQKLIDISAHGTLNIHYSLLPRWRGASPVEASILASDTETGITIQKMVFALDAGPVIAREIISLDGTETTPELRARLIKIGGELLSQTLPEWIDGNIVPELQDETLATRCTKIKKEDGLVDLEPGHDLENWRKYRAYKTWPRIFFIQDNKRVIINNAHFENGKFIIDTIIPEGKKEMAYKDFLSHQS